MGRADVQEWMARWQDGEIESEPMSAQREDAHATGRRAVLVSSPAAGSALRAGNLELFLAGAGINVAQHLLVSDLDHTQPQGPIWRDQGYDLVIAAGGDGTVGSVATQLVGSGLPLAILPLGTANDVARSLYVPMDVSQACGALAGAVAMDIDVGQVIPGLVEPGAYSAEHSEPSLVGEPSPLAGVCFLHALTLGLNVEFARLATDVQRRQRLGNLTYAASAMEAVTRYQPVDVTLRIYGMEGTDESARVTERVIQSHAVQVTAINTPVFGGKIGVRLPDVSLHDRLLDFMLIEAVEVAQLRFVVQRLLDSIILTPGQPTPVDETAIARLPGVRRFRARAAIIETDDAVDVTLDGEIRTHTPVFVRAAPQQVRVLVSPQAKSLLTRDAQG
jgi:diacylglycerol kinase (ATP)